MASFTASMPFSRASASGSLPCGIVATRADSGAARHGSRAARVALRPAASADRVSAAAELPGDLDDVTDADGDGDRGLDGDGDGMSDALEIHRYGDLATYRGPAGSVLIVR